VADDRSLPHLHCSQRRRTTFRCRRTAPTLLIRAGRAMFVLFLLFCIFPFSCSKIIIIPSLNSGLISCVFFSLDAFFSIYLSDHERKQILGIGSGRKKTSLMLLHLGRRLGFLSIFSVFVTRHVQGTHGGLRVVSWSCLWVCSFLQPTLSSTSKWNEEVDEAREVRRLRTTYMYRCLQKA
jgi:hypothetical protein